MLCLKSGANIMRLMKKRWVCGVFESTEGAIAALVLDMCCAAVLFNRAVCGAL